MKKKAAKIRDLYLEILDEMYTKKAVIVSEEDYEKMHDGDDEEMHERIYESPKVFTTGRHGEFMEFVVGSIDNGTITAYGLYEQEGSVETFYLSDLTIVQLCELTDYL